MRILFFGIYDRDYSCNRVLIKGLESTGAEVVHCNDRSSGILKYVRLVLAHWRMRGRYDVVLSAFPSQAVTVLARMLTRRPILCDAFTSHYEGYVEDRKLTMPGSFRARWYRWLDTIACRLADVILVDTNAHADYFARLSGLDRSVFHRIFVGTDTDILLPAGPEPDGPFTVHFHGTDIPLQGIPYILQARDLLKDSGIIFNLIGVDRPRVPYESLGRVMAQAHVCLGIFGDTSKAGRVIPNKVFEALAVGRPVITADTPAIRELLDDASAILIPTADPRALADAILKLKGDPALRLRIGQAGRAALLHRATPDILGRQVFDIIKHLLHARKSL